LAADAVVTYDQTLTQWNTVANPAVTVDATSAPWNNGQNGGSAEYGSAFCFSCHQGRVGNTQSGTDGEAVVLDPAIQTIIENLTGASVDATNGMTAINHPTNMRLAYREIGGLTAASVGYFGQHPSGTANGNGWPQAYATGLALSNAGYTMYPVRPTPTVASSDGRQEPLLNTSGAPICQQCHEDFRDVETAYDYTDTDKNVPFSTTINTTLGVSGVTAGFIQAGNPQFQNFPHETEALRMLVEGGDSAQIGGGNNDDLCLNCHVPGSTVRILDGDLLNAKDLQGFME
jgi:hypothetical protein